MVKSHLAKGRCLQVTCERAHKQVRVHSHVAFASSLSSQASLEYLLVVALTFAIIIPTTYLFYNYSKESTQEITDAQITKLGRSIIDVAESIFYSGEGSKTVLELNVPDNVDSALIIDGRELVFNITTNFGISEIVFLSSVNITTTGSNCNANICKIPGLASSGFKKVKIEAVTKDSVSIEVV